jgi:8-oxo-dGTP diphosphatase
MSDGGPVPGVGAVIVADDRILLVRRGRGAHAGRWAVPGGKQRFGETMREAVAREVLEETGLVVDVGDVVWVGDALDDGDPPAWHYALVDFACTVAGGDLRPGDDALDVAWVTLAEARELDLTPTMPALLDGLGAG